MFLPSAPERAWTGNYTSIPAATLKAPVEGNRSIPVEIVWSRDGLAPDHVVWFNAAAQRVSPISQIASLHVSNLHSTVPVRILFRDTGFEIEIAKGIEGFYPIVTNTLEFLAYTPITPAAGDACTIQVLNFLPPPIMNGVTVAGSGAAGVQRVDTAAPLQGGPITDLGTVSLQIPLGVSFGGTGGSTNDAAMDGIAGVGGSNAGMWTRASDGTWDLQPIPSGSGPTLPLVVGQGGTSSTTGFGALDTLSQAGTQTGALQRQSNGNWSLSAVGTGTVSSVLPGVGLTGGGAGPTVTLGLQWPIAINLGGTAASDPATALSNLGGAPLASPIFTGDPRAPTPPPGDNDTSLATTAFVQSALTGGTSGYLPLTGGTLSGSLSVNSTFAVQATDQGSYLAIIRGTTNAIRVYTNASSAAVEAVLNNVSIFVPLEVRGTTVLIDATTDVIRLDGTVTVTGSANVSGNATVTGSANVSGNATVTGNATITGSLNVSGTGSINGNALNVIGAGPVFTLLDTSAQQGFGFWSNDGTLNLGHTTMGGVPDAQWATWNANNLTVWGTGNDPLNLIVPSSQYCRIKYQNQRIWTCGLDGTDGSFIWADETAASVRMGIDTAGRLQGHFGATFSGVAPQLDVRSNSNITNAMIYLTVPNVRSYAMASYADANWYLLDQSVAATRIVVDNSGNCFNTTGTWGSLSDASLKQSVKPYLRGLDAIKNLNPVSFQYAAGTPFATEDDPSPVRYGLIADEVYPYIPEVCGETSIAMKGDIRRVGTLNTGDLMYSLINAVKELAGKIDFLETQTRRGLGDGYIAPEHLRR